MDVVPIGIRAVVFSTPLSMGVSHCAAHTDLLHPQLPLVTAAEYFRVETTSQIKDANCAIAASQAQTSQLSALSLKCPRADQMTSVSGHAATHTST